MDGRDASSSSPAPINKSSYLGRESAIKHPLTDHVQRARAAARRADATVLKISEYVHRLQARAAHFAAGLVADTAQHEVLAEAIDELGTSHEELRVAEEELRRQNLALTEDDARLDVEQQQYQELVELAAPGYVVTDAHGVVREANRAAADMLAVRREFLIGKPLTTFVVHADSGQFLQALRAASEETWAGRLELRLRPMRDGAPVFAELSGRSMRRGEPEPGALSVHWEMRDVSTRKEAELSTWEAQLETRVRARTEDLENMNRGQAKLITDLLDAARILAGNAPMIFEAVDMGSVVKSAVDTIRAELDPRIPLIQVKTRVDCQVLGDVGRLEQVVRRLLLAASDGGTSTEGVLVHIERDGGRALLVVSTGDRIFEDDPLGAAIPSDPGLMLPHAIVDLHGGTLSTISDAQGCRRQFTVRLPMGILPGDVPDHEGTSVEELSAIDLDGVRALIVDADPERCELLMSILRQRGAEVTAAAATPEALMMVEDWRPDVIVCDVGPPDDADHDLIRRVRRLGAERGGSVPAVALTGYADLEASRSALVAGYQVHVAKPVDASLLAHAVANVAGVPIGELSS